MSWLLDANVLVALFWENHIHHEAAIRWFVAHRAEGWATCCLTELTFLRISMGAFGDKRAIALRDALRLLVSNVKGRGHEFWPLDYPPSEILPEIQERIRGHQQLPDAILLDLAIRRKGRLATFDRGVLNLLSAGSPHRGALRILAAD